MSPGLLRRLRQFVDGQAVYGRLDEPITLIHGINPMQRGNVVRNMVIMQQWERDSEGRH